MIIIRFFNDFISHLLKIPFYEAIMTQRLLCPDYIDRNDDCWEFESVQLSITTYIVQMNDTKTSTAL